MIVYTLILKANYFFNEINADFLSRKSEPVPSDLFQKIKSTLSQFKKALSPFAFSLFVFLQFFTLNSITDFLFVRKVTMTFRATKYNSCSIKVRIFL